MSKVLRNLLAQDAVLTVPGRLGSLHGLAGAALEFLVRVSVGREPSLTHVSDAPTSA